MGAVKKILVLGGTRSGKSRFAEELFGSSSVRYVATSTLGADESFARRVSIHQQRRPSTWETLEIDPSTKTGVHDLCTVIAESDRPVLVEALGAVSVGLLADHRDENLPAERATLGLGGDGRNLERVCAMFTQALTVARSSVVVVSEEVGLAPHPLTEVGRRFVDLHGALNQAVAAACDEVYLVVAGRALSLARGEVIRADVGLTL